MYRTRAFRLLQTDSRNQLDLQVRKACETLIKSDKSSLVVNGLGCNQCIGNVIAYKFILCDKI